MVARGIVPEGAESFATYSNRVIKAINKHLAKDNRLFVAHGGTIMAVFAAIGKPLWNIDNTALYRLVPYAIEQNSWRIEVFV